MTEYAREQRVQRYMRRIIGVLVLATALLAYFHSKYWLFGTMFIGLNLLQFGFTDWCLMKSMLDKVVAEPKSN